MRFLERRRRRLRLSSQAACGIALTLALTGCFGSSSSSGGGANANPAAVLPASTWFYAQAYVRPTDSRLQAIDAASEHFFQIADPGAKLDAEIDSALHPGVSYEKNIQPWLGQQAGVAVLSATARNGSGAPTNALAFPGSLHAEVALVLDQTNTAKATAALRNGALFENKGAPADKRTSKSYRGVSYVYDVTSKTAVGVVGDFVVLATVPAFEAVVDVTKGDASLAASPSYTQTVRAELPSADGLLYVPVGTLIGQFLPTLTAADPARKSEYTSLLSKYAKEILLGSLSLSSTSATLDFAGIDGPPSGATSEINPISGLPAGSWLALGVTGIGPAIENVFKELAAESNSLTSSLGQSLATLKKTTGLDVETDLESLTTAGLFIKGDSLATLEAALVLGVKAPADAPTIVNQLRAFAGLEELSSKSFTVGRIDQAGVDAGFTIKTSGSPITVDVVASRGEIVVALDAASLSDALSTTDRYATSNSYSAAASLLGSGVHPDMVLDLSQLATLLKSLGVASTGTESTALTYLQRLGTFAIGTGHTGGTLHERFAIGSG
jgi:hypothetical protein